MYSVVTARRGRVVNIPALYPGVPGVQMSARRLAILTDASRAFPQSLQAHAGIIISLFYSSVEHRVQVKVRHLVLFAAKAFTSVQLHFSGFNSLSTVRRHVVLRPPLFLVPCGFHSSAAFVT
jgi:hypothetical protein